jgi:rhodanese-related sulfurtransferase
VLAALVCAIVGLGVSLPLSAQEPDLSTAPRITVAELKKLWDAREVVVVDVRDHEAFRSGHIPGAVSIPLDQVVAQAGRLETETKPIVTYCA